jgi:hypothetical protein
VPSLSNSTPKTLDEKVRHVSRFAEIRRGI